MNYSDAVLSKIGALRPQPHAEQISNVNQIERWASIAAGAGLALAAWRGGLLRNVVLGAAGAALVYRGATGYCHLYGSLGIDTAHEGGGVPAQSGVRVQKTVRINRPPEEVYRFWRNLENLPRFMDHLQSVRSTGGKQSHWVARGLLGSTVEWDAEIINERQNELIAWESIEGSEVDTAGSVHFEPTGDGNGTVVNVNLKYNPVGGKLGVLISELAGEDAGTKIDQDLQQLKRILESNQTAHSQPLAGGL